MSDPRTQWENIPLFQRKIRVQYEFEGRKSDIIVVPFGNGIYQVLEDYTREFLKYFPNATFELVVESQIEEFEIG